MFITLNGYTKLTKTLDKLYKVDLVNAVKLLEETRPIGVSDEFPPEYLLALENQNKVEKRILDIKTILNNSEIFFSDMLKKDKNGEYSVGFGAKVTIHNLDKGNNITYTIVSSYESDISSGLISIDAPFVKEMKGLKVGDIFEFNDYEYEIIDITSLD